MEQDKLQEIAKLLRYWILDMTTEAGSGHPTSSLSAVELMTTLFFHENGFFRYDLNTIEKQENDRLIFSKGHASPLFYSLWAAAGAIEETELNTFRKFGSRLEGHPTRNFPYTEIPTGSLGQGLGVGMGMALDAKYLSKTDTRTFVLLGDSECAEGSVWEAAKLASFYTLGNLVAIVDMNRLGQRGETMSGHNGTVFEKQFEAFGWKTILVDGHDMSAIASAYDIASQSGDVPTAIIAKTFKGKGISFLEDKENWHGKTLSQDELTQAKNELGEVDHTVRGVVHEPVESQSRSSDQGKEESYSLQPIPYNLNDLVAVREAYGLALIELGRQNADVVVLDAEVSNSTYSAKFGEVFPERFFEMYIAEQNMISAAVGLARRGKVPFVSTFSAFLCRGFDQLRMAQYAGVNMVVVGSHVGVSIGEDGASQMGLEDIAVFRSLLESSVLYPSDAVSMMKLVVIASRTPGITYIRATRAKTPVLYTQDEEFMLGGSKTLRQSEDDQATIVTAGVTVEQALEAAEALKKDGINVRVIDVYSVKPIDSKALHKAAEQTKAIITVEDHYPEGGIGAAVREALAEVCVPVHSLCVRKMPKSGSPDELLRYEEIDADAIQNMVRNCL